MPGWVTWLPALNALLNGTSAVFLVLAYRAIRRRDVQTHARRMLVSRRRVGALPRLVHRLPLRARRHEVRRAWPRPPVYFVILISHVLLSAAVLPLIFFSLFFSLSARFPKHKAVARYTLPIWLYVSVTGVLVFAMLRAFA